jgi:hypothetical protein
MGIDMETMKKNPEFVEAAGRILSTTYWSGKSTT